MPNDTSGAAGGRPTYLVVHPGAELFGSDRMALESVRGLVLSGARVIVALPEQGALVPALVEAGASVVIVPMLVLRKALLRPRSWAKLIGDSVRGLGAAWRLLTRQRPDALYVSTATIPQWPVLGRLRGIPVVTHIHESEGSATRLVNMVLYAPQLCATTLIVNSDFSLRTLASVIPGLRKRTRLIYNGVAGPPSPALPRTEVDRLRVLYIGRLSPRKGVDLVIEAGRLLEEQGMPVHISLLGSAFSGYEWYVQELRDAAAAEGAPTVDFLGFQSDVWPALAENDVLVVPSRFDEPFGNTAVEGILAHRPVVVADTSGLREAAAGYPTAVFVPPSDPTALADALASVAARWTELRKSVAESAVTARERHSPRLYRKRVSDAVAAAARQRPRR